MTVAQVVRKSEFAKMRGVSPGRVTQWITEGKIGPDALVGEGRSAQINAPVALAHLRERLDVDQRFGLNGVSTRLDNPAPLLPPPGVAAPREITDSAETQIKAEKLTQAQIQTRRMLQEERAARGVYVRAEEARAEYARIAADFLKTFDGALVDFASALAGRFQVPQRDVLHLLRGEFRKVRERAARKFADAASLEAEVVDDDDQFDA